MSDEHVLRSYWQGGTDPQLVLDQGACSVLAAQYAFFGSRCEVRSLAELFASGAQEEASKHGGKRRPFLIRRAKNGYLDNQKVSEKKQHMAEKLSLRYVEIRGLF